LSLFKVWAIFQIVSVWRLRPRCWVIVFIKKLVIDGSHAYESCAKKISRNSWDELVIDGQSCPFKFVQLWKKYCFSSFWGQTRGKNSLRLFEKSEGVPFVPKHKQTSYILKLQCLSVCLSRSWNPDLVCPSVEVLKPRSRLSVCRGPETQICASVCRGPETQIPSVRLSRSWNSDPKL
jgi:hypothetical protein